MAQKVFCSHSWGNDGKNHSRVSQLVKMLEKQGIETWFDENKIENQMEDDIKAGLENSTHCLFFLTKCFFEKLENKESWCAFEFSAAKKLEKHQNLDSIIVIMEEELKEIDDWPMCKFTTKYEDTLYVDASNDDLFHEAVNELIKRITGNDHVKVVHPEHQTLIDFFKSCEIRDEDTCSQYASTFVNEGIDNLPTLISLIVQEKDLIDYGIIKKGHQRMILKKLKSLNNGDGKKKRLSFSMFGKGTRNSISKQKPPLSPSKAVEVETWEVIIKHAKVNVRDAPNIETSNVIGSVAEGDEVQVIRVIGNWLQLASSPSIDSDVAFVSKYVTEYGNLLKKTDHKIDRYVVVGKRGAPVFPEKALRWVVDRLELGVHIEGTIEDGFIKIASKSRLLDSIRTRGRFHRVRDLFIPSITELEGLILKTDRIDKAKPLVKIDEQASQLLNYRNGGIYCDNCNAIIGEFRNSSFHHCKICPEYDLCESCFGNGNGAGVKIHIEECEGNDFYHIVNDKITNLNSNSGRHPLIPQKSGTIGKKASEEFGINLNTTCIRCDGCQAIMSASTDEFYRCKICKDYDLCPECKNDDEISIHQSKVKDGKNHQFYQIKDDEITKVVEDNAKIVKNKKEQLRKEGKGDVVAIDVKNGKEVETNKRVELLASSKDFKRMIRSGGQHDYQVVLFTKDDGGFIQLIGQLFEAVMIDIMNQNAEEYEGKISLNAYKINLSKRTKKAFEFSKVRGIPTVLFFDNEDLSRFSRLELRGADITPESLISRVSRLMQYATQKLEYEEQQKNKSSSMDEDSFEIDDDDFLLALQKMTSSIGEQRRSRRRSSMVRRKQLSASEHQAEEEELNEMLRMLFNM